MSIYNQIPSLDPSSLERRTEPLVLIITLHSRTSEPNRLWHGDGRRIH